MKWLEMIGSALPIIGQGVQTLVNSNVSRENTDKTIQANRAMAEYQYSKDLEMWNRGNMYNAPQAQMERLKKAGLNPNMVYGSGNPVGASSAQLPKYNAPTASYNYQPPVDIPSMIGQFQDFRIKNAQAGIAESNARVMDDTEWSRGQIIKDKMHLQRIQRDVQREYGMPMAQSQADYLAQRVRNQTSEQERLIAQTRNLDLQNDYFAAKAITGLFGGLVGSAGKIGAMFRKNGSLSTGTLKNFKPNTSTRHQWRGNYIDNFGYDN